MILLLVFGLLSGCTLSVLVGLIGARRTIGFGWAFLASLLFTPLVGLLITLVAEPLPGPERRYGCIAWLLGLLGALFLAAFLFTLLVAGTAAAAAMA